MEILIVEDDFDDLMIYEDVILLIDKNLRINKAGDGDEALQLLTLSDYRPDVVLLDYNLPKMSGLELLREIRADPRLANLFVAVLSTACQEAETKEFKLLGADCHKKPHTFSQLMDLLRRVFEQARTMSS